MLEQELNMLKKEKADGVKNGDAASQAKEVNAAMEVMTS